VAVANEGERSVGRNKKKSGRTTLFCGKKKAGGGFERVEYDRGATYTGHHFLQKKGGKELSLIKKDAAPAKTKTKAFSQSNIQAHSKGSPAAHKKDKTFTTDPKTQRVEVLVVDKKGNASKETRPGDSTNLRRRASDIVGRKEKRYVVREKKRGKVFNLHTAEKKHPREAMIVHSSGECRPNTCTDAQLKHSTKQPQWKYSKWGTQSNTLEKGGVYARRGKASMGNNDSVKEWDRAALLRGGGV